MSRGPDIGTALCRAIQASAERAGIEIELVQSDWTRWASATFTGARHELVVAATPSPRLDRWMGDLPEAELPIRGHLVADLRVARTRRCADRVTVELEVLTVESR